MPGIRVRSLPKQVSEKDLKVHFSNPKHGGGTIKKIYYPLPSNDAVILFEERQVTVVDQVMKHGHPFSGELVEVEPLPENMVYLMIDAKLDAESSVIVRITPALKDEMEYVMAIKITQEPDQTYRLQGNWFQLEWAWHYIDQVMQQQEVIQHRVSKQSQQYAGQPLEVDVSTDSPRNSRSENKTKHQRPSSGNALLNNNEEIVSLSYRGDRDNASRDIHSNRERELPGDLDTERSGVRSKSSVCMQGLQDNSNTEKELSDDELHGIGHSIPPDSMQSITSPTFDNKRYRDENDTFSAFSGTESTKLTPGGGAGKSSVDNSMQENAHDENKTSLQLQSPVSSPSKSSYKRPHSGIKGYERSTKPLVDAGDQSLGLGKSKFGARLKDIPRPYSEDQLLRTFDIHGLKVTVYYGSLVEEDTEAIVNAADEYLSHYGGISYAIKKARGHEMDDECFAYKRKNGNLKITEVMHTTGGGRIKALHIMHTTGPMWGSEYSREKFTFELTQTFINCLQYAEDKLHIKKMAFPAISTGVCGAPLDTCVRCFLDAILIFTHQHGSSRRLADVRLVNNDAEKTNLSVVLMQTLIDRGIESLTEKAMEFFKRFTSKDLEMNHSKGRSDYTNFSRTYTPKTSGNYGATGHGLSEVTTEAFLSRNGRGKSLSRAQEKRPSPEDKGKDERGINKSHSDRDSFDTDTKRASDSEYSRHRDRSGSLDRGSKKDSKSNFSKTVNGVLSYRDEGSSDRNSQKRHSTADTKFSVPKMKLPLHKLDTENIKNRKTTTAKDRVGVLSNAEYGSFTHTDKRHSATSRTPSDTSEDEERGMHSLPANLHTGSQKGAHSGREKFPSAPSGKLESCAICLDEIKDPKQLPQCKHIFCRPCIERHFASSKPSCPTCGALYGKVVGDQPEEGKMYHSTDRNNCLPGYESEDGMIVIKYTFPDGVQKYNHPHPGKRYKGLERKAYLPNSVEGREVLRLLKKAFDARLVFTIGDSKTSGRQDVLTWNDIHHKTSIAGGSTKFGYPDPGYLRRVKDELAAKGIVSDK